VTVTLAGARLLDITDLSTGGILLGQKIEVDLKPYQLRAFRGTFAEGDLKIIDYRIPLERKHMIMQAAEILVSRGVAGKEIASRLQVELAKLNYVQCKYILEEEQTMNLLYPVGK
jgi:hypothetical protein